MTEIATPENKTESYKIFDNIAKTYDFLNIVLSLGIDRLWRRKIIKLIGKNKIEDVLDLATGTGDMAILMGKKKNIDSVIGLDMSKEMISIGQTKIQRQNLEQKVVLDIGDGMDLPVKSESKNLVTITFGIRNFGDYEKGLREMFRVLKPGGRCIVMEFSIPQNFIVRSLYLLYFRNILPFLGNIISGNKMAYSYLNKTVEQFPYGLNFSAKMKEAGFNSVNIHPLTLGIASIYVAEK
jgi:demethylmenaquinone methyltransferase / 2-methoxy-6-polyprenyl-1,4-benzoquinol methylase